MVAYCNTDGTVLYFQVGRIQVIAFQSSDGRQNQTPRPISMSHVNGGRVIDLDPSLSSLENVSVRSGSAKVDNSELDTANSQIGGRSSYLSGFFANADSNYQGLKMLVVKNVTKNTF